MTTHHDTKRSCPVCGTTFDAVAAGTPPLPDLVHPCPGCGYAGATTATGAPSSRGRDVAMYDAVLRKWFAGVGVARLGR